MKFKQLLFLLAGCCLVLMLSSCLGGGGGGGDDTSSNDQNPAPVLPAKGYLPRIVSVDSTKTDAATLFWLGSSGTSMKYNVHLATQKDFTPDASNLKKRVQDDNEADITGLTPGTTYWARVVAIDANQKEYTSEPMSLKTSSKKMKLAVKKSQLKKQQDLNATTINVQEKTIQYSGNVDVSNGDILIGTKENPYLRKVTSVSKKNGKTKVTTEDIAISDIISDVEISSTTVLFDNKKISKTSSKSLKRQVKYYKHKRKYTTEWKSGRFSVSSIKSLNKHNKRKFKDVVRKDGKFEIRIPENDSIKVEEGTELTFDVVATMLDKGIDDDFKFTTIKLLSLEHDNKKDSSGRNFGAYFINSELTKNKASGKFCWTPRKEHVSTDSYTATFEVGVKDDECSSAFDMCNEYEETIEIEIYVIGDGTFDSSSSTKITTDKEFRNNLELNFTPTLELDHIIEGMDVKYVKAVARGKLDFNLETIVKFEKALTKERTVNVFKCFYESVYAVGPVPIYQEVTFTIDATAIGIAKGSIEARSDLRTTFDIQVGTEYKDGEWKDLGKSELKKDYTATVQTKGGVSLELRLIPNIEVKFYKAASAGISVEPWVKGEIEASATATYNTDFEQQDVLGLYKLDTLDVDMGIDGKFYADLSIWKYNIAHYPRGGGKKLLFHPDWTVFSLPKITVEEPDAVCGPFDVKVNIEDGINNPFDDESIVWRVFPESGSKILSISKDKKTARIQFSKQDEYEIYCIGNSQVLGKYGKQYEFITVDTRDCEGIEEDETPGNPDADHDGIADALDLCPNTPSGETVNANGCSDSQAEPGEPGSLTANFTPTLSNNNLKLDASNTIASGYTIRDYIWKLNGVKVTTGKIVTVSVADYMDDGFVNVELDILLADGSVGGMKTQRIELPKEPADDPDVEYVTFDGMEFVLVRGGCYDMGDTFGDGWNDEQPVHNVCLGDFYIGKYEVTQGEWKQIMGSNPSWFKNGDRHPVELVSWNDVQEFITKLHEKTGKQYRLPSESEWEYAARSGGKKEKYSGGDDADAVAWYGEDWSSGHTHEVGTKSPNGLGIYDMSGNVWEWCQDKWHWDYIGAPIDGSAWETGDSSDRVERGGSWGDDRRLVRAALRDRSGPGGARYNLGFRLVLPVHGQ